LGFSDFPLVEQDHRRDIGGFSDARWSIQAFLSV